MQRAGYRDTLGPSALPGLLLGRVMGQPDELLDPGQRGAARRARPREHDPLQRLPLRDGAGLPPAGHAPEQRARGQRAGERGRNAGAPARGTHGGQPDLQPLAAGAPPSDPGGPATAARPLAPAKPAPAKDPRCSPHAGLHDSLVLRGSRAPVAQHLQCRGPGLRYTRHEGHYRGLSGCRHQRQLPVGRAIGLGPCRGAGALAAPRRELAQALAAIRGCDAPL
mmetsp:Transcript_62080/g.176361  ORF Transcript_62080/g.176361 Transcript_62080/m.176361 type:complete len:223 (+) Transcript_62080:532-1200(+)